MVKAHLKRILADAQDLGNPILAFVEDVHESIRCVR